MKYIAHRGLSSKAPENTLEAFKLAGEDLHYFGIECDIQPTLDGYFVVFHDQDLKNMCKSDKIIKNTNFIDLANETIKSGSNIKNYPNLKIPLFSEYLDVCSRYNKTAVIEIKRLNDITEIHKIIEIIENYPALNVIIISFKMNFLKYIRALSDIELLYLTLHLNDETIYDCKLFDIGLNLNKESITKEVVQNIKDNGLKVGVFTVNNPVEALAFEKMGVDYLTTDNL